MSVDPERARTLRRRRMHERQAVVFGVLLASLALAGLGAAAVYTETVEVPFLARDFSTPTPTDLPAVAPCPPAGAVAAAPAAVTVNVYNGSGRPNLAGQTLTDLGARGFLPGATGNSAPVKGTGRISFGAAGVTAAYVLWDHVDGVELVLDQRADATVDFALGEGFSGLVPVEEVVVVDPSLPLPTPTGCIPLEQVTPVPVVGPLVPTAEAAPAG